MRPRIVLIHPPHPEAMEDRLDPPLGLLLIAGMLEREGYQVTVNDLQGVAPDEWKISEGDLYGITVYATSLMVLEGIIREIYTVRPGARIVVGGAHPTSAPYSLNRFLMTGMIHSVVLGEGEISMVKAAQDYPDLKGGYHNPLGKMLDSYPPPSYHLVDLKSYRRTIDGKRSISFLTSRGCPYECAFCALPPQNRSVKFYSVNRIISEIELLKFRYGIEAINFQDDCFTLNPDRLYDLCERMKKFNLTFRCHGRVGRDRKEDYFTLREAGCSLIAWGIESGSQTILDKMRKRVTVKQNEEVIKWARECYIISRAFFVFGFPGESEETVNDTIAFIERANPDQYFVSNFVPYPGTPVWDNPSEFGITKIDEDFAKFFQVDKTGTGGRCFDVVGWTREEMRVLEIKLRDALKKHGRRGPLLAYERRLEERP